MDNAADIIFWMQVKFCLRFCCNIQQSVARQSIGGGVLLTLVYFENESFTHQPNSGREKRVRGALDVVYF